MLKLLKLDKFNSNNTNYSIKMIEDIQIYIEGIFFVISIKISDLSYRVLIKSC
jgi:hypothetical protein